MVYPPLLHIMPVIVGKVSENWSYLRENTNRKIKSSFTNFLLGHPPPTITWMKEESREDILWIKPDTPGYKLASSNMHHSLILLDVKKKYSGAYTCIATNKAGQSICTANLEVADGKSLLQHKNFLCISILSIFLFFKEKNPTKQVWLLRILSNHTLKNAFSQEQPWFCLSYKLLCSLLL